MKERAGEGDTAFEFAAPTVDGLGAFVPGTAVRIEGSADGPLNGLTFAVKDIFDIAGETTGCGNPDWARTHPPAQDHAPVVRSLLSAGAELVGKTITDELAYSLSGQNFHYGSPCNVNAPGRITGGSSSGSASAVAGGVVDFALGSDTGGSVRIPASYCGLFGLRPTHGRLSLQGVMPLAASFDTVGWFARDAGLLRRVGEVLFEENASQAFQARELLVVDDAFELAGPKICGALMPQVEALQARVGRARAVVVSEPGGGFEAWMQCFRTIQAREVWQAHGAWVSEVQPQFGPEVAERFGWAQTVSAEEATVAQAARESFSQRLEALLENDKLLCLPTAPGIAPLLSASVEDLQAHRSRVLGLTSIAGLAGLPQITLPLVTHEGCPVGLSLIAPRGADMTLLALAEALTEE